MPDENNDPRVTANITVRADNYDDLVAEAHARAVEFLGPDRVYYLTLGNAQPHEEVSTGDGNVRIVGWEADARIVYPHDTGF